jgi:hypothetical protein
MVTIHPSVDRAIRLVQIRLLKLGYNYDYSSALNGVIIGAVLLGLAAGSPDPEIVMGVREFLRNMASEEIPEETLTRYEEYVRKMDKIKDTDQSRRRDAPTPS